MTLISTVSHVFGDCPPTGCGYTVTCTGRVTVSVIDLDTGPGGQTH